MSPHCSWHGVSLGVGGRAQGPSRPVESRETTRAAQTLNESGRSHGETGPAVWGPRRSQGGRPAPRQAVAALTRKPRPSRFGSFEIFKPADESTGRAGPSVGRNDIRVQMLDYVVGTFYPEIQAAHAGDSVQRNAAFFREVRAPAGPPAEGATQPLRPVLRLSCPSPPGLHLQGMRRRPVHPVAGGGAGRSALWASTCPSAEQKGGPVGAQARAQAPSAAQEAPRRWGWRLGPGLGRWALRAPALAAGHSLDLGRFACP